MAYDFPTSPTVGQLYPVSPPAGTAQYRWDGQAWVAASPSGPSVIVPPGTVMLFYQAAAPLGWTKLTTQNDKALRVVSGNGGVAGGTNSFSSVMAQSVTGNTTLAGSNIPNMSSSGVNNIVVYPAGNSGLYAALSSGGWSGMQTAAVVSTSYTPITGGSVTYASSMSFNNTIAGNTTNDGGHSA